MRARTRCLYCDAEFDLATGDGVAWVNVVSGNVGPPPPPDGAPARRAWVQGEYEPHCAAERHRLPAGDAIVVSVFGETLAGKGALVGAMRRLLSGGELSDRHLVATLDPATAADWDKEYRAGAPTERATAGRPRRAQFLEIRHGLRSVQVVLFDTGGEDLQAGAEAENTRTACPFIPATDVFVFVVPPPCLPDLPEDVRSRGSDHTQSLETSVAAFARVIGYIDASIPRRAPRRRDLVAIVVLSKCDRYLGVPGFPDRVLRPRRHRGDRENWAQEMLSEQVPLYDFVERYGGRALIDVASQVNGTVFLTAVSGTGNDEKGMAPAATSAANRALDPLAVPLLWCGMGEIGSVATR